MSIDPLAAAAASNVLPAGTTKNQGIDQKQFLLLFIEQLKNQDPLAPMEPNELTAQLAQFSSLEQLTGVNTRLDGLSARVGSSLLNLLDKEVRFEGDKVTLDDGVATSVDYTLDKEVDELTVTIRDANGREVRSVDVGSQAAGAHEFVWDGKGADGKVLADGTYRIEVMAKAAGSDEELAVPVTMLAKVEGVDFTADPPTLRVNGQDVPLEAILEVRPSQEQQQDA
ncbi:MAG TPA: FlgD immunoglobulin-like domain containing protein [Candidatus Binatia bacterium]|jgi:flagellar basal-body rod modification protein FlgD|nr:FlgD immunoglobulin-like domain containing protein [Candidatus Binatia bacterium]